eukprot:CAMPEP_0202965592 /NCGR_PEP_ID=MMETSP1396-20130829/9513_1 /ASSEMBLY_ACC=CAM_ASM_000872 /TAXON_ID= /ORGANISM="Pseudokeronopsis sp., Strain Brazil" /LENGTH=48 /DNA_ID= /DNA_START= /DNA_END= /DNA_ORIENTATION=
MDYDQGYADDEESAALIARMMQEDADAEEARKLSGQATDRNGSNALQQ